MRRRGDYESRRIGQSVRASRPVETPATEACTVYRQHWRRVDGTATRVIDVLALDSGMAIDFGAFRLSWRHHELAEDWQLSRQYPLEGLSSILTSILTAETEAETNLRETTFRERNEAEDRDPGGARTAL